MESWNGAIEWSLGVDFGVELSQILSNCCTSRTGFVLHSQFGSFAKCRSLASLFHKQKTIIGISNPHPV